jgi:hypothetical protein
MQLSEWFDEGGPVMKYLMLLHQRHLLGQMAIYDQSHQLVFILAGSIHQPSHTLFLYDSNRQEVGRLFLSAKKQGKLIDHFIIKVMGDQPTTLKKAKLNLGYAFYLSKLHYWVWDNGCGCYTFKKMLAVQAQVDQHMLPEGMVAECTIKHPEDVPYVLLVAALLSEWNYNELKLPEFKRGNLQVD